MTGRYKAYPDLSITGEVIIEDFPEHWSLTRIKFNSLVKARVGWHGLKSDDFTDVGPYLVTGSDFKGKFIQWKDCYHCDVERYEQDPYIQLTNGDLLITKDGTIGKVALVSELDGKATLNSGVFVVRPLRSDFTTQYYYWLLLSRAFTDFVDYYKTGSTIAHLYQETFVNFKYPLPPYEEQQKIANFLDHETAKIDTLITKQEKLIELLKEKRQAVISQAVTKGLPSVNGGADTPMKDSGVEWLGEVPEHWVVPRIKQIVDTPVTDGPHETPTFVDSGVPFVSAEAVSKGVVDFSKIRGFITEQQNAIYSAKYAPKIYDIYMVKSGATTGVTAIVETNKTFNIWSPLAVIRCKGNYHPYFVLNSMRSHEFLKAVELNWSFGTQQNIGMGVIENLHVACPPIDEAIQIANYLQNKMARFEILISKATNQIELMKERKTALISAAVTGKIDVRDWHIPEQAVEMTA